MRTKKIIITAMLMATFVSSAQENDSTKNRPAQVSFIYPLGTNGIDAPKYSNNVSFNILTGLNGGVNGFELGGLVNSNTGHVNGGQIAGIANVNTKSANGFIAAGIVNVVKDSSQAICVAGIANVMGGKTLNTGLHIAGVSNYNNSNFIGGQIGGITNINNGNLQGAQIAGIGNTINGDLIGTQISGISNLTNGNVVGSQLGLINKAKNVKGFQLGLINVANEFENGVPIGLFSFVKNGYHAIEVSGSDAIYTNMSLKLGVKKFYNIFKIGFTQGQNTNHITYGLGFGSLLELTKKLGVSADVSANHIVKTEFTPNFDLLSKVDLSLRYNLGKHIDVFAGPSFNVYLSENELNSEQGVLKVPYSLYSENWWNNNGSTSFWIGANAGVSVRF
jgi:hypothetical protein